VRTSRRNGHEDDPHDRAWALAEIWGDLTHLQTRALYGALASDDRDAFNIVANQHKRAGLRGLTGHAIEAFSILRSEIVDDGRERNTNTDDDAAEQAANDEREQNAEPIDLPSKRTAPPKAESRSRRSGEGARYDVDFYHDGFTYRVTGNSLEELSDLLQGDHYPGPWQPVHNDDGFKIGYVRAGDWRYL
jgi:hypothetical protein